MTRKAWLWLGLAAAVATWTISQRKNISSTMESFNVTDNEAMNNSNVLAFLRAIRAGESSQSDTAYNMLVYGGTFSDMSTHPKIFKPIPGSALKTSAAGAYQITYTTWLWLSVLAGVDDFTPASQDLMAVAYLRKIGALADIVAGNYAAAAEKCRPVWEAFIVPSLKDRIDVAYLTYGGTLA